MKNKFINFRLFYEFFKQIRVLGIIITVVLCGGSAFWDFVLYSPKLDDGYIANISDVAPILYYAVYLIPIVFTFKAFSFLYKRKACDFYHSIPDRRSSVFVSAALAAICWSLISIIAVTLAGYLSLIIIGSVCPFSYALYFIAYNAVIALLITGCASIALSITGTLLSGLILTVIIMFLPRIIIFLSNNIVRHISKIAYMPMDGFLFDPDYNFLTAPLINIISSQATSILLPAFGGGYIYSITLSIIYLILGCFLFCRRKSETADNGVFSPLKKHAYSLIVSFPMLIIAMYLLLEYIYNKGDYVNPIIIVLAAVSVAVYFIYVGLTSRSAKATLKSAPIYLINIGVCALIGLCSVGIGYLAIDDNPSPDQVSYLKVGPYYFDYDTPEYEDAVWVGPRYSNEEMIEIACEQLAETSQQIKVQDDYMLYPAYSKEVTFALKSGRRITRRVFFWQDVMRFEELLNEEEERQADSVYTLPKDSEIVNMSGREGIADIDSASLSALWESYKREYAELPASIREILMAKGILLNTTSTPFSFDVSGNAGMLAYSDTFYITPAMPETFDMASRLAFSEERYADFKEGLQRIIRAYNTNTPTSYLEIDISFYNVPDEVIEGVSLDTMLYQYSYTLNIERGKEDIIRLMNSCEFEKAEPDKEIMLIELQVGFDTLNSDQSISRESYTHYISVKADDELYPKLKEMLVDKYMLDREQRLG